MVFEYTSTRVFIYSMIPTSYLTIITLSCNRVIIHFSRSGCDPVTGLIGCCPSRRLVDLPIIRRVASVGCFCGCCVVGFVKVVVIRMNVFPH